jgi:hypothetical protein
LPVFKSIYEAIKQAFIINYLAVNTLLFYFIMIAWAAVFIHVINYFFPNGYLKIISDLCSMKTVFSSIIAISVVLLQSMLITCMFAEPNYRYHHFIIPFKVVLAFYGLGICIHFIKQVSFYLLGLHFPANDNFLYSGMAIQENRLRLVAIFSIFLILSCFFWGQFIFMHA